MRRTRLLAAATLLLLLPAAAAPAAAARREPTYKGHTAEDWAPLLADRHDGTRLEAMTAILAIGKDTDTDKLLADVTPLLDDPVPMIRLRAARWFAAVRQDARAMKVALDALSDEAAEYAAWVEAVRALEALGPKADYALPRLKTLYEHELEYEHQHGPQEGPRGEFLRALPRAIEAIERKE